MTADGLVKSIYEYHKVKVFLATKDYDRSHGLMLYLHSVLVTLGVGGFVGAFEECNEDIGNQEGVTGAVVLFIAALILSSFITFLALGKLFEKYFTIKKIQELDWMKRSALYVAWFCIVLFGLGTFLGKYVDEDLNDEECGKYNIFQSPGTMPLIFGISSEAASFLVIDPLSRYITTKYLPCLTSKDADGAASPDPAVTGRVELSDAYTYRA